MNQQEEINQEVEIDFGKYVRIIWNGKIFIIILTTIITLLSVGYSLILSETFKSSVTILPEGGGHHLLAILLQMI